MADRLYCANCLQMASGPMPCCEVFDPPSVTKAVAESARAMLINCEIPMTDPTTRDPAASLARCIELAAKATPGPWTTGEGDPESILSENDWTCIAQANTSFVTRAPENAATIAAAVNFLRDDAPALLAEVDFLRERVRAVEEACSSQRARAEAAEQVAREAVALLRAVRRPTWGMSTSNWFDARDTFLAHHGARTGESNEA